jgi:hypothetical protein
MEDLAQSVQGDQFEGCSPDEAALVIEQAVALHAPRWGDPELASIALQPGEEGGAERVTGYYRASVGPCLDRLGDGFGDDVVSLIVRFGDVIGAWATRRETPPTIVHGDFRPDNFLFGRSPEAPPLAVVDWQTVSKGLGPADVAYFVGGAFDDEQRSRVERDLVESYRQQLNAAGVPYSEHDCWRDYRWGSLHGVVISVLATMMAAQTERGDRMLTLMATRHARHALDLDALDLVERAS